MLIFLGERLTHRMRAMPLFRTVKLEISYWSEQKKIKTIWGQTLDISGENWYAA